MLYAAYEDSRTEAIWAVRGGYGCAQLVEHVDWSRLPAKPLVGYSDITVLLDQCYRHGLPAIHGPVIKDALRLNHESSESRTPTRRQMLEVVDLVTGIKPTGLPLHRHANSTPETIAGPVVGGNLMTLACIAGTSCQFVAPPHALVILEDVGEPYYRLERALWQLVHSGALDQAGALCMGTFEGCTSYGEQSLAEIAAELISPLSCRFSRNSRWATACSIVLGATVLLAVSRAIRSNFRQGNSPKHMFPFEAANSCQGGMRLFSHPALLLDKHGPTSAWVDQTREDRA
ncbi:LD-carboxypeptidase [Modicisalibacter luteus]|uniref:LD-carboxypeptidase n=1 Tax=Modicisalibacter luteus TaxID=453962 RepID=UPI003635A53A